MRARLLALAAAASLLVFLAVLGEWMLSYARPKLIVDGTGPDSLILYSSGGGLEIERAIYYEPLGRVVGHRTVGRVQYGYLAALAAVLPLVSLVHRLRERARRRLMEGLCVNCGYDLRATPEQCPECGAVPAAR